MNTQTLTPSGGDDTAALQAALNTAGASVQISGTLRISATVTPAANCSIATAAAGAGGILWTGPSASANGYAIKFAGSGLTIGGVMFNGAGLNLDGSTLVDVLNCTFENIPVGSNNAPTAVYFGSIAAAWIINNRFQNIGAVGAICGFDANNSRFSGNTFVGQIEEPIHIIWNNAAGGCDVSYNDCSGFNRHGIELQGDPQGLTVLGNYVHDPAAAASHIWLSIATGGETTRSDCATGVVVKGNVLTAPVGFNLNGTPINYCAIEAMGEGTQVIGNFIAGMGWGGLYADNDPAGATLATMSWANNQYHAVAAGVPATAEGSASYLESIAPLGLSTNTQDNVWDGTVPAAILATVGPVAMPLSTTSGGSTVTPPISIPVTLSSTGGGELTVSWAPPSPSASVPVVSIVPTNGAASMAVTATGLTASSTSANFTGIPAGWKVTATVTYGAAYSGSASMQVSGGPAPTSNASWPAAYLPPTPPPPAKTITHVITTTVYSDGSYVTAST